MSRHIDALIAEHVFGEFVDKDFPIHGGPFCKNYSTSIADAWLIVEKMHDRKYISRIQSPAINYVPEKWSVCFHFKYMDDEIFIKEKEMDESAPMAIAKAALKALGVAYE